VAGAGLPARGGIGGRCVVERKRIRGRHQVSARIPAPVYILLLYMLDALNDSTS
jgi:hypothetical protein